MSKGGIRLELVRSGRTKGFVLVVLSIPLILALLLTVLFVRPGLSARDRLGPDSLVGITAALLAVLPIRAVLVPPDLPSLTLVDYILGFEMAVLLAVACLAVRRVLRSRPGHQ